MKYFKLVNNSLIIGVVTSNNFMHYSALTDNYIRTDEQSGEYVSYKGKFYRDGWMQPFIHHANYQEVAIIEIDEIEYNLLLEAFQTEEVITYAREVEPINIEPIEIIDTSSIDFIRLAKINEMSHTCNQMIENGFDIELQDGVHHFSLTVEDQLNLMSLSSMVAQGIEQIPYHADGELCKFYTPAEITAIVNQATMWKTYHTTYFNALKAYINSLDTIEAIGAITYGIELPEEFKTDVLRAITQ